MTVGGAENHEHDDSDETESDPYQSFIGLYRKCVRSLNWSLKEIDETDFELLLDFLFMPESADPNTRTIRGKTFTRATAPPAWL
ncbi:hypothetical protein [Paenibacillus senegalimassiliensis]|uniref:hypothetical protein n=1 Tax=Paenibacillus senegalimassiliensis TaxID=1737426 RepID=UPI00073E6D6C|nr:hypothetical protein [Paenibacillus senegalimassiliensis]